MNELEMICFQMISLNGSARSYFMEALQKAKAGCFDEAAALMEEGDAMFVEGHRVHMELITQEARGDASGVNLLLIHAEDQMMSAEVVKFMAQELIEIYQLQNKKAS